jgi:uncharacterized protein
MGELSAVNLILFVSATFAASFVTGLAGFAFAIVAAAIWLHFLPPAQSTVLIAAFGLIVQGWAVWNLRHAIRPVRLAPFLIGAVIGVPLGTQLLRWASPDSLRFGIGVVLVAFSLYSLIRPRLPTAGEAGHFTDGMIGTLNGALGGATGFAGIPDHLVHIARMAAARAARRVPAGRGICVSVDRTVSRRHRKHCPRHG